MYTPNDVQNELLDRALGSRGKGCAQFSAAGPNVCCSGAHYFVPRQINMASPSNATDWAPIIPPVAAVPVEPLYNATWTSADFFCYNLGTGGLFLLLPRRQYNFRTLSPHRGIFDFATTMILRKLQLDSAFC